MLQSTLITSVSMALAMARLAAALPSTADVLSLVGGQIMQPPPKISSAWVIGEPSSADKTMTFTMAIKSADVSGLEKKMLAISESHDRLDGGEPWLSEDEVAAFASPSAQSLQAVTDFFSAAGIKDSQLKYSKFKDRVTVAGVTLGRIAELFGADFFQYTIGGKYTAPRTLIYTIPASLKGTVTTISPFNVFMNVQPMITNVRPMLPETLPDVNPPVNPLQYRPAGTRVSPVRRDQATMRRAHRKHAKHNQQGTHHQHQGHAHGGERHHRAPHRQREHNASGGGGKPVKGSAGDGAGMSHGGGAVETPRDAEEAPSLSDVCTTKAVTPQCLRMLYQNDAYEPLANQAGEDVAIMGYIDQSVSQSDLTQFLKIYRPDAAEMLLPIRNSHEAINIEQNPGLEAMLDVETVVSQIWPLKAAFQDVGTYLTQGDVFQIATQDFIDKFDSTNRPRVVTTSYGADETGMTLDQAQLLCDSSMKLSALGTTLVYSSGDNGVAGTQGPPEGTDLCPAFTPTYPSGCAYVLSVGALQSFAPEAAVGQDMAGFYGGAGFSDYFDAPDWQTDAIDAYFAQNLPSTAPAEGNYRRAGRAYPDVSAQGYSYAIVQNGQNLTVSGTSASAPTFASNLALLNDARRQKGLGTLGWLNPALYRSALGFTDITKGGSYGCTNLPTQDADTDFPPGSALHSTGFPAGEGWDPATGVGSPIFPVLRERFGA